MVQICFVRWWCPREAVIVEHCLPTVQPTGAQRWGGHWWTGCVGRPYTGQTRKSARPGVHHGLPVGTWGWEIQRYSCKIVEACWQEVGRTCSQMLQLLPTQWKGRAAYTLQHRILKGHATFCNRSGKQRGWVGRCVSMSDLLMEHTWQMCL